MSSRYHLLTDAHWDLIAGFMPDSTGLRGRSFNDHQRMVEGMIYRYRTGIAWRDLPEYYGPWQSVWKRLAASAGMARGTPFSGSCSRKPTRAD